MNSGKITIRDVAREAGVSLGSTSRVLNDVEGVKPRTRDAVLHAAEKLGYTPNLIARALRSRSSGQIGFQFSDLANPLQVQLYSSLEERFADAGYVSLMSTSGNRVERERRTFQTFIDRGIDALVAAPVNETDPEIIDLLRKFPAPVVLIDRDMDVGAEHVNYDHKGAMDAAIEYLVSLGHSRVSPVFNSFARRPGRMRQEAFAEAAAAHLLDPSGCRLIQPETPNSPVTAETMEVLSGPNRPTALVVQGTQVLHSVLNAAALLGFRIPADLSILAIGDSPLTANHVPALSVLTMSPTELVDAIADTLLAKIRGEARGDSVVTLHYSLVERGSCGPPPPGV